MARLLTLKLNACDGASFSCRRTGVPSHPSAMPCPASSVSSQPGLNASNCSGNSTGSSFSVPYNIPNITSSYVNTTSYIIYAYDFWEKTDALAGKNMGKVLPSGFSVICVLVCVCTCLNLNSQFSKHHTERSKH